MRPDELLDLVQRRFAGTECTLMEVCGTHTNAIRKAGIHRLLPAGVRLLSGPGCPVCVTGGGYLEQAVHLGHTPGMIITTFGDLLKVPGNRGTLGQARAEGVDIRIVYSPLDAVALAEKHPSHQIVFLGVGFETTAPVIALAIREAQRKEVKNFSVLPALKVLKPALVALLRSAGLKLDGLIAPGHLSVITGAGALRFLPEDYHLPTVVTGFRKEEIWLGITALLRQIATGQARLENMYADVVTETGNVPAQTLIREIFAVEDTEWRGLGLIPGSGLAPAGIYRNYDARVRFEMEDVASVEPPGCRCGEILIGRAVPEECPHFGHHCTPEHPVGPCTVSGEGSCAAYFYSR